LSTAFSPLLGSLVGSGHCGVKRRKLSHHALIGILFIGVDGLSMLAKIVETRELLAAMASERTFASVFPNVPGQVFAPAKNHATIAITTTLERFGRRGTISPVDAAVLLQLRILRRGNEGGHVVAVRRVGVH
jgi:hypothetical protein